LGDSEPIARESGKRCGLPSGVRDGAPTTEKFDIILSTLAYRLVKLQAYVSARAQRGF